MASSSTKQKAVYILLIWKDAPWRCVVTWFESRAPNVMQITVWYLGNCCTLEKNCTELQEATSDLSVRRTVQRRSMNIQQVGTHTFRDGIWDYISSENCGCKINKTPKGSDAWKRPSMTPQCDGMKQKCKGSVFLQTWCLHSAALHHIQHWIQLFNDLSLCENSHSRHDWSNKQCPAL